MERKRILYAEDNSADAELTLSALADMGLRENVAVVSDGVEALDYLCHRGNFAEAKPGLPQLVLLDLRMPRMDGIATLSAIRNHPCLKTVPVVMLTASNEEADLARCYALGANAYVVKPVTSERFSSAIESVGAFWLGINEPPPQVLAAAR